MRYTAQCNQSTSEIHSHNRTAVRLKTQLLESMFVCPQKAVLSEQKEGFSTLPGMQPV